MSIIKYRKGSEKQYEADLKYWSNACGELHYHGQFMLKEKDLPEELLLAYNKLWSEGLGPLCYLAEYENQYGVALISEFDAMYAEDIGSTMAELYLHMENKAIEFSVLQDFTSALILLAEEMGCLECHEFCVFLPYDTPKETFNSIADIMLKKVYE